MSPRGGPDPLEEEVIYILKIVEIPTPKPYFLFLFLMSGGINYFVCLSPEGGPDPLDQKGPKYFENLYILVFLCNVGSPDILKMIPGRTS